MGRTLGVILLVLVVGCSSKEPSSKGPPVPPKNKVVTSENYLKIQNGMTEKDVEAILGPCVDKWYDDGVWELKYTENGKVIQVTVNQLGRVYRKTHMGLGPQ